MYSSEVAGQAEEGDAELLPAASSRCDQSAPAADQSVHPAVDDRRELDFAWLSFHSY